MQEGWDDNFPSVKEQCCSNLRWRLQDAQEFLTIILEKINFELESLANNAEGNSPSVSMMSLSSIFGFELKHEITCNRLVT